MMTDDTILRHLIHQVQKAAKGSNEREVTTVLTRPMWQSFLRAVDLPEYIEPTGWNGLDHMKTARVFGSETFVYGDNATPPDFLLSISFNRQTMTLTEAFYLVAKQDPRSVKPS